MASAWDVDGLDAVSELDAALQAVLAVNDADLARTKLLIADAGAQLHSSLTTLARATGDYRKALALVERTVYDPEHLEASLAGASSALLNDFVRTMVRVGRDSMATIEEVITLGEQLSLLAKHGEGIDHIAVQTRQISLNARIETQRAGTAGRTFEVVANEVKRLANGSLALSQRMGASVTACQLHLARLRATAESLASNDMSAAVHAHRGLGAAIALLDSVQRELCVDLSQVDVCITQTVRALQFEDMVTQIIDLTLRRNEVLTRMLKRVLVLCSAALCERSVLPVVSEISGTLRSAAAMMLVEQTSMAEGTVDLF
jgi:Methyl-accepting chemotaxis protein (MCP) signalling domain